MSESTPRPVDQSPVPPAQKVGVIGKVVDGLKSKGIETVTLGVLAIVGFAFWSSWDIVNSRIKNYIVQVTVEELDKENNKFFAPIKKTVDRLRSTEIGALSVGNFTLTPNSPSYILPLYFPRGQAGQLSVQLTGHLIPNRSYVVLVLPNGEKLKIETTERTLDLAKYLKIGARPDAEALDDIVFRPDSLKALRALTFQLAGRDTETKMALADSQSEIAISIHYVALISPPINLGDKP